MVVGDDFKVPPKSWDEIFSEAEGLRALSGHSDRPIFPVMEFIEHVLYRLDIVQVEVVDYSEMKEAEAYTCPKGSFIMFRNDVYQAAHRGEPRARFTAAHELGHFFLHSNVPMARASRSDGTPHYSLAEPQANQFAAELLMPRQFFSSTDDAKSVVDRHLVSTEAAQLRLQFLRKKGII